MLGEPARGKIPDPRMGVAKRPLQRDPRCIASEPTQCRGRRRSGPWSVQTNGFEEKRQCAPLVEQGHMFQGRTPDRFVRIHARTENKLQTAEVPEVSSYSDS